MEVGVAFYDETKMMLYRGKVNELGILTTDIPN